MQGHFHSNNILSFILVIIDKRERCQERYKSVTLSIFFSIQIV